jgi:hypothetical protein
MKKIGAKESSRKKKIVIVGGSHSGFSCAWLMLHQRPAQNTAACQDKIFSDSKAPGSIRKYVNSCKTCCHCSSSKMVNLEKSLANPNGFGSSAGQPSQGGRNKNIENATLP